MVSVEAETTPFTEIIIDDEEEEKIKQLVKEYGDSNNLINLLCRFDCTIHIPHTSSKMGESDPLHCNLEGGSSFERWNQI